MNASLCLVSQSKDNKLELNPKALELIESLTGKISIVVIVGKYREGKSFLSSHLLRELTDNSDNSDPNAYAKTFQIDHDCSKGFTKGLWMNSDVKKINLLSKNNELETVNLIMIDSELKKTKLLK